MGAATSRYAPRREACVFCDIVRMADDPNSRVIYSSQRLVTFRDIRPAARQHLLVVPREHIPNVNSLGPQHTELVQEMKDVGVMLLQQLGHSSTSAAAITAAAAADMASAPTGHPQQQQQDQQYKFGFHRPPFRSVDHLHLHCFTLPHLPAAAGMLYCSPLNWVPVDQLLQQLGAKPQAVKKSSSGTRYRCW